MTEKELIEKYDLENHPMWNVPVDVWCESIHHEFPFEKTTEPGRNRLLFVVRNKPENEIPVRLAAMKPCTPEISAKLKTLDDDYRAKRKPLDDDYWANVKPLDDDYRAKRKTLYTGKYFDWDDMTLDFSKEVKK